MIAETVADLVTIFRSEVDDAVSDGVGDHDKLWKTWEVLNYATEAVDATAKRVLSLTQKIDLTITAGQGVVALPQRVLNIRDARLLVRQIHLLPRNANELNRFDVFNSTGTPRWYVADYSVHALDLYPTPDEDDMLRIQCSVTIDEPLAESDDFPFTDLQDTRLVLEYMKHLAYKKQDAETLDLQRSVEYRDSFDRLSRERAVSVRNYRRRPAAVRMNW